MTNIEKTVFDALSEDKFEVKFGRDSSRVVHEGYHNVESGDCFVIFNSLGLLEIGIKQGNAAELMGLDFDSPIIINFDQ